MGSTPNHLVSAVERHLTSPSQKGPFALLCEVCREPKSMVGTASTLLKPTRQRQADGFLQFRRAESGQRSQHLFPLLYGVDGFFFLLRKSSAMVFKVFVWKWYLAIYSVYKTRHNIMSSDMYSNQHVEISLCSKFHVN